MAFLWKLAALTALLLMPFGMAGPAAAAAVPAVSASHHCGGEQRTPSQHGHRGAMADCSMCSMLAADFAEAGVMQRPAVRRVLSAMLDLDSLMPEVVPPPPRMS